MSGLRISKENMATNFVIPRTLRAEVQTLSDKTGESFGEIIRQALIARLAQEQQKERDEEEEEQAA